MYIQKNLDELLLNSLKKLRAKNLKGQGLCMLHMCVRT